MSILLHIRGMDCVEEVALLKRELVPLVKEENRLSFDLLAGKLTVDTAGLQVSADDVLQAVERTGLAAEIWTAEVETPGGQTMMGDRRRTLATTISGLSGLAGLVLTLVAAERSEAVPLAAIVFYSIGIIAGLWLVAPKAWRAATTLRPDMNLLMSVAVVGAVLIGEWFEGATVAFLFSLSLVLESWSVGRARRAIGALLDLSPPVAHYRIAPDQLRDVPPADVPVGATVVVRPGEKIPLDGRVRTGTGGVNQAPITGESVPVEKGVGDEVFAGSINGDGLLEIETTKAANDTTLARIIRMVGQAGSKRAPAEQWVEQFAAIYTPVVMGLALLMAIMPPLLFGERWSEWFYRSLVVLVIACPCALVISTPVSIVAALAAAARHGVLIKGGIFVELPGKLRALAMDKTGTLTIGEPKVAALVPLAGQSEPELLQLAAALELNSNHPLARAIVEEAEQRGLTVVAATAFEAIVGQGATGIVDGQPFWIGSHRLLRARGQDAPEIEKRLVNLEEAGRTVVVVGTNEGVLGMIALADEIRPETRSAIEQLHEAGIRPVVMLTGDNENTAQAIAREAGIDEVYAGLSPEQKYEAIERLVADHEPAAMVGDGVNDAPALARASLGLAMGAAGSDAAIETADIALMADDLSKLPWLVEHSRRTLRVIQQNIGFSLAVKVAFVVLTFAGYASLWAAIAADMGASLLVIANGLRLLKS